MEIVQQSKHIVRFLSKREVAENTFEVRFSKPENFEYRAGQFLHICLDVDADDRKANVRSMSLSSAPYETHLMVTMRMTGSAWKQKFLAMNAGDTFEIVGPRGRLFLHNEERERITVFIAGGIGVAPFRSMIFQEQHENSSRSLFLFHFNRRKRDITYFQELNDQQNERFHVINILTNSGEEPWVGEVGYCREELLQRYVPDYKTAIYYIIGVPEMVLAVQETLTLIGIAKEDIRGELFTGYSKK